jgi:plasmid maintenance system antidote protein VapI
MALRIEKVFGVRMDTLMRMQASYDIAQTRKPEKTIMPGGFPNQQMPMCEETVVALTVAPRSLS